LKDLRKGLEEESRTEEENEYWKITERRGDRNRMMQFE
jgi:hypothetical protein